MKYRWFIAAVLAMAAGCADQAVTPPPEVAKAPFSLSSADQDSLVQMKEGNTWTYGLEETVQTVDKPPQTVQGEMTWRFLNVTKRDDGTHATCEISTDGRVVDRQEWLQSPSGVFQLSGLMGKAKFSTPQPIIAFPVKQGGKVSWEGTGPTPGAQVGKSKFTCEVLGPEDVDTESESVHAIAFHSSNEFSVKGTPGQYEAVSWFEPGVGLVRYRSNVILGKTASSIVLRLRSTNVKQP